MRMNHSELVSTYETYKALNKQRRLALAALDGSARYDCIYLHIVAELEYVRYCLRTLAYHDRKPWLVCTRYF